MEDATFPPPLDDGGPRPGTLEALWDYEKGIGRRVVKPVDG